MFVQHIAKQLGRKVSTIVTNPQALRDLGWGGVGFKGGKKTQQQKKVTSLKFIRIPIAELQHWQ